jgi:hypothetical protein
VPKEASRGPTHNVDAECRNCFLKYSVSFWNLKEIML